MKKGVDYIGVGIGAVIVDKHGKIFLAKRGKKARNEVGCWECPGGGLEFGDSFEDTIIREMKEEFDIEVEVVDSVAPFNHIIHEDKQHWVALAFICKIKKGKPKIMEPDKCEAIGWFSFDEMEGMNLSLATKHRLKQMKEKLKTQGFSSSKKVIWFPFS